MEAKPMVKWAGGKRSVLSHIQPHMPEDWTSRSLVVPFTGGGAFYFAFGQHMAGDALLGDAVRPLVAMYTSVRDSVESVVSVLGGMKVSKPVFLRARDRLSECSKAKGPCKSSVQIAADMIYVNRCGFNGLYRTNAEGGVNTPWGKVPPDHRVLFADALRACSDHMQLTNAEIHCRDFRLTLRAALARAQAGERLLLFVDPPYWGLQDDGASPGLFGPAVKESWTGYTAAGFNSQDQVDLLELLAQLRDAGAHVISTNHWNDGWIARYAAEGFEAHEMPVARTINRDASKRGAVREVILVGAPRR